MNMNQSKKYEYIYAILCLVREEFQFYYMKEGLLMFL